MRALPCNNCEALMINGIYCHETGCPDKDKPTQLMDRAYYEEIVSYPGKFEQCAPYVPYFWDCYLDGDYEDDDGDVLTFVVVDNDLELFPELEIGQKIKLVEWDNGFVVEANG